MKFRLLTQEELEPLKEDFIKFLSANTITGEDWDSIKAVKPDQAKTLLEMFCDIVWEKSLEKINYLEHRDEKYLKVFRCGKEKIEMVGFSVKSAQAPSLLEDNTFQNLGSGKLKFSELQAEFHTSEKSIGNAVMQKFKMMENGCVPCEEAYFYGIKSLVK
tara:strand:+ start:4225 stop:4704 length:480 start_codon:yes stop_codon:yes gene_type:complete